MPVVVGSNSYYNIIMYHGLIYDIGQNMIYNIDIKSGGYIGKLLQIDIWF